MGRAVMEGVWTIPWSKHVGLDLAQELKSVRQETDRLRRPERVLQAVCEVAADGEGNRCIIRNRRVAEPNTMW